MRERQLHVTDKMPTTAKGTAGFTTFVAGQPATVSALAIATGGIANGRLVETDK